MPMSAFPYLSPGDIVQRELELPKDDRLFHNAGQVGVLAEMGFFGKTHKKHGITFIKEGNYIITRNTIQTMLHSIQNQLTLK